MLQYIENWDSFSWMCRCANIFEYSESFASELEGLCVATLYKAAQKDGFKKFANYLEFIFHLDFIVKKLFTRVWTQWPSR